MTDKVTNWYSKLKTQSVETRVDKTFKNHRILPCSMIACIGQTGCGKSNSLIDFLHRKIAFYRIIIFTGSSSDEPLYNYLREAIPEIEIYVDIRELPELNSFPDDENKQEKLIVFDDWITLKRNELKKIEQYFIAGRKKGFTCWCNVQSYISLPKIISRQIHYYIIFKINDMRSIGTIVTNHNIDSVVTSIVMKAYNDATAVRGDFFMIDLKNEKTRFRHNFLNILELK